MYGALVVFRENLEINIARRVSFFRGIGTGSTENLRHKFGHRGNKTNYSIFFLATGRQSTIIILALKEIFFLLIALFGA